MKTHFFIHESFESPAAIETWTKERDHTITYTRFYQNDPTPNDLNGVDFLIVMGGPQSPTTTEKECPHFHAKEELACIRKAIDQNKLVLGVCLGAQLIGEALGAECDHSPNREIGVFNAMLTDKAQTDSIFSQFPHTFPVGHWHGDMPGLTPAAEILATSEGCPRQIIKYTPRVYGFQCHFELTPVSIEGMIQNSLQELERYKILPYVEDAETLRKHDYAPINTLLFQFLDAIQSMHHSGTTST